MANPEHVKILKQGVEVWNQWREENPNIKIDLEGMNLHGVSLQGADLRKTNLTGAHLESSNLGRAHLEGAVLEKAVLERADLEGAHLEKAVLREVNLQKANLRKANLGGAKLGGANLRRAHLERAHLGGANLLRGDLGRAYLIEANLIEADLRGANLQGANLRRTYLKEANLEGADLRRADLEEANLEGADLRKAYLIEADLQRARLSTTNLSNTNITGVKLYGTARDDWIIDGIICDYVYWDRAGKTRTPEDRDFRPGEFEELYRSLPTFEYIFEHGFTPIDALVMDQVVQTINQQNPEYEVKLTTLDSRGQPHAVFTVISKDYVEPARKQITTDYEARLAALEGKQEQMMELFARVVNNPQLIVTGDLTIGNKRMIQAGRDYVEQVEGDVTTGASSPEERENQ